mgnify:CR=1 FL=1
MYMISNNLIFDIWGTLYDWKRSIQYWLEKINRQLLNNLLSQEEMYSIYKNIYTQYAIKHWDIVLWEIAHFNKLSMELSYKGDLMELFEVYKQTVIDNMFLFKNVKTSLEELYKSWYNLYILSNWRTTNQILKLKIWWISELFKTIYISEDIGIIKPDKKVFQYILSQENLNPQDCIMIWDSVVEDIKPAMDLWMKWLLFTTNPSLNQKNSFSEYKELTWTIRNL